MLVMQISKHSPGHCPLLNEDSKKAFATLMRKMDSLLGKHGVKVLGMWNDTPAHTIYAVFEAPNTESFMALGREPEMMAWLVHNVVENRPVITPDEVKALLGIK